MLANSIIFLYLFLKNGLFCSTLTFGPSSFDERWSELVLLFLSASDSASYRTRLLFVQLRLQSRAVGSEFRGEGID
jgi:hypothetical protein